MLLVKNTLSVTQLLDGYAISGSAICAIHCLCLPLLLVTFPALGSTLFGQESFHKMLVWLVIPLSAASLLMGCKKHKDGATLLLGLVGMLTLIFTAAAGHALLGEYYERIATLAGASVLALAHVRNFMICRGENCAH